MTISQTEQRDELRQMVKELEKLAELHYDLADAYDAAIEHVQNRRLKEPLSELKDHHDGQLANINVTIVDLGGGPAVRGDLKRVLREGSVTISRLAGDQGILRAMSANERQ